ncbi:hypothetical protein EYC84_004947 [Monilinia fructicola]|uniref:Uncharacterized protein n=1 Tax=Monilinia fructicola TaxID=38448 RepID=A0A5M9K5W2_MONFR|nr:hypothetical protein EYC84_004947 [Monilinia fructicola]
MEERKLLERRLAHMTGTILFMASQENPQLPLNHPSQPSFIPIQKAALHRISLMFSELIEKNQDGLIDDEEIVVYDPTLASSTHKKFVQDQIIYVDGLINSFYSQGQDGHDDLVALSDDRIWKAFESILKFAKWGNFGENSVTTSRQRDLHTLCFYLDVSDDFKADLDRVCMGERDFETDMD